MDTVHPDPNPSTVLERHAVRRTAGVPTVSVLVGPVGAGGRAWRRWVNDSDGRTVTTDRPVFPLAVWLAAATAQVDILTAAVRALAERVGREPESFVAEWRTKTDADRERYWHTVAPNADDDIWQTLTRAVVNAPDARVVPVIAQLGRPPGVLFVAGSLADLTTLAADTAAWVERVPALPLAVVVSAELWSEYLRATPDSRAKAILREGAVPVPVLDAAAVYARLEEVGVSIEVAAVIAANGADSALVAAASEAARATADPQTPDADDRARSAAERFLFDFLESLPETAGRFALNDTLDFRFGPRNAEVDLLCRTPKLAVEIDGYHHFRGPADYRRDRSKDWELQRRGFLVLRFLAEDVISDLEQIRDRVLQSLHDPAGEPA